MWTKKNDHAPKSECANFEDNLSLTVLLSSLGLHLSSLLVKNHLVLEDLLEDMFEFFFIICIFFILYFFHVLTNTKLRHVTSTYFHS